MKVRGLFLISVCAVVAVLAVLAVAVRTGNAQGDIDLRGTWDVELESDILPGTCELGVLQRDARVLLAGRCSLIWPLMLWGTIDTTDATFAAQDAFGAVSTHGEIEKDGESITGTWTGLGFAGTFSGTKTSPDVEFVDNNGHWTWELGPVDTPLGEFSDTCDAIVSQSATVLVASIDCQQSGDHLFAGGIDPLTGEFYALNRNEEDELEYVDGVINGAELVGDFRVNASDNIRGPAVGTRISTAEIGDVDCNRIVNSIDATLVLQATAGLLELLACPEFSDVNGDLTSNSLDAVMLLQGSAGLIRDLFLRF